MWPVNEIIDSNDGRSSSYVHRMSNLDGGAFVHRYIELRRLYRLRLVCVRRGEREEQHLEGLPIKFPIRRWQWDGNHKTQIPRWNKPTERKAVLWKWSISWRRSEARSVCRGGWETQGMWSVQIGAGAWRTGSALPLGFVGWRDGRRWSRPVPIIHTSPSAQIRT